jgi:hypothetical protein
VRLQPQTLLRTDAAEPSDRDGLQTDRLATEHTAEGSVADVGPEDEIDYVIGHIVLGQPIEELAELRLILGHPLPFTVSERFRVEDRLA